MCQLLETETSMHDSREGKLGDATKRPDLPHGASVLKVVWNVRGASCAPARSTVTLRIDPCHAPLGAPRFGMYRN
jgi:hypothetical protein